MKIIVLTSGRTGSMALFRACQHVQNFTTGHDSKSGQLAAERAVVPDNHIEIDTRLAWFLGRLAALDNGDVHYVHLTRDPDGIAQSYNKRWANRKGIMRGYCEGLLEREKTLDDLTIAQDMIATIDLNIAAFLKDRPHSVIRLETLDTDLPAFFAKIGADVDVGKALSEFTQRHNRSRRLSLFTRGRLRLSLWADALERGLVKVRRML